MALKVGVMTKRVRKRERPTITWLGGVSPEPMACLRKWKEMTIRVKAVRTMRIVGSRERKVKRTAILMGIDQLSAFLTLIVKEVGDVGGVTVGRSGREKRGRARVRRRRRRRTLRFRGGLGGGRAFL